MYIRHLTGIEGEELAVNYLEKNNYTIIERNFLCKQGEIDIIAKDNKMNEYVFIEVKTRNNDKYGKPIEAVDKKKQKHILHATKYYIYKNKLENVYVRFDVVAIYKKRITHFKNCNFSK